MKRKLLVFCSTLILFTTVGYAQQVITGADRDKHGCIGSAGYTYSILKKDCIRVFEQKIKLHQVDSAASYKAIAAVIFSADNTKAEVFLASYPESQILIRTRKKGKYVWKKGKLELSNQNGYRLKEAKKLIYTS
ncbi:hypothetical protein D3C87_711190 [compost metagenome]